MCGLEAKVVFSGASTSQTTNKDSSCIAGSRSQDVVVICLF